MAYLSTSTVNNDMTIITPAVDSTLTVTATSTLVAYLSTSTVNNDMTIITPGVVSTSTVTTTADINMISLSLPAPNAITGTFDTTNTEFASNHGLQQIGAHKAYERGYFGQNVTVGVIDDTGVDTTHTDLTANIISGQETAIRGG